jgi:hypothetical protein
MLEDWLSSAYYWLCFVRVVNTRGTCSDYHHILGSCRFPFPFLFSTCVLSAKKMPFPLPGFSQGCSKDVRSNHARTDTKEVNGCCLSSVHFSTPRHSSEETSIYISHAITHAHKFAINSLRLQQRQTRKVARLLLRWAAMTQIVPEERWQLQEQYKMDMGGEQIVPKERYARPIVG